MNFRAFLFLLGVFLSVLRICYVENPEAETGPKPSSNIQNSSLNVEEASEAKSAEELPSFSSSSSVTISSPSSTSSSSSSSSNTDTSTESVSTFLSKNSISSSELEQLVLPTVAPATPHFDTETISSSLSVIVSVTESIHQDKRLLEESEPQHEFLLVSNINSDEKQTCKNEEKGKAVDKQEIKGDIEEQSKDEAVSEKIPEEKSITVTPSPEKPDVSLEKKDASASISQEKKEEELQDTKIEEPKDDKQEPKDQDKEESKSKQEESKDKEDDSITAELKQAEDEPKPTSEDMPSFDEFKRQHLQEEEKQKNILKQQQEVHAGSETINKPKPRKIKQRKQNNYASIDCGAKILKANPEASNIFSILQDNRDLYMLNPCSAKIWFIVELCDNVQVKTIEIANFELFSSTPESFKVYVSGRYPTREWTLLGTFQARSERNLQSFPLDEPIYAKYIKVEMLSHFGTEHYCPLSLFRVFGTSMMEELEDHEAGGQDDGDGSDHDDDSAQVLPPDPSAKEDDKETKSNILATVGDTLFNMVKVVKKLTGVIDSENNLTSDGVGTSTVAPSSSIVSSTTSKEQDPKPSIVTLIPSDDEDDKIQDAKQDNRTTNATSSTDPKKPGRENERGNTTFYDKIDPDSSRGSKTTSAFTGCELLVRMLRHSSFGCMMGKVLYSKRKGQRGFTPKEESSAKQKASNRNMKAPPGSESRTETNTDKAKEDSKNKEEKKEGEKESKKVEEKGKKNGKENVDEKTKEPIVQMEGNRNGIILKNENEEKQKGSSVETKGSSDLNPEKVSEVKEKTSTDRAIDPVVIVQPSEVQPPIIKPCDSSSEDKGTPVLTTTSVLTTHPSGDAESKSTQTKSSDVETTLVHIEKSKEETSESHTRKTIDVSKVQPDEKDGVISNKDTRNEGIETTSTEVVTSKSDETVTEIETRKVSTVDESSVRKDTCSSVDALDKSLIKPSQSSSPSECKAPSIATPHKDVDVLEFKILDSASKEGTAHLEKPPEKPVEPVEKPVQPGEPVFDKEPIKEEEPSVSASQSSSESSSVQDTVDVTKASPTDDLTVSASSSSIEPTAKPSVVLASTPEPSTEQPTDPPEVKPSDSPESISPLPPPPVDKPPMLPPPGSIEASISDDLSSVLNKAPSSATAGAPGMGSSGAQKESIFMRLTNRIKALEQNLTLSTLYMEKLNQKYRKIVEDMQKNFDKKVNLLTNATRKAEAVIKSQKEQISALQSKVDDTSRDMKDFNKQLKSLNIQVMERHIIGLFLEVILIMILFIVFRRWDRARIRRDLLRESRMNGTVMTSYNHSQYPEDRASGKMLNGQLSGREQLQRSFANPNEPEIIGALSESIEQRHKEEFFPPLDTKKKRNRKRPKSGIITSESSQLKTVSEPTNQTPTSNLVSVTAGLLFSPARGLLNGFKRSQSMDDSQLSRKSSLPSTSRLSKTKSLNVIQENSQQISTGNAKKGRVPTPPPPPSTHKYWNGGSTDGLHQKRLPGLSGQQPSNSKVLQKKGRGLNGTNPYA